MRSFKNLLVWEKSEELAYQVYLHSRAFPREELFGLTSQIRRAALSVSTNLAEGCGRQNPKETKHFASIALGSLFELESLLAFSKRLGILSDENYIALDSMRNEVGALLWRFHKSFY